MNLSTASIVLLAAATLAAPAAAQCKSATKTASAATQASFHPEQGPMTILETAAAAGSFETLAAAIKVAGLEGALSGKGPFTVFAPTDEAFAKLPKGTLESLVKPENRDTLVAILTYHVVAGQVQSGQVVGLPFATTLNGQRLGVNVSDAGVRIGNAGLVKADINCSNGVIHVVDTVLLPNTSDVIDTAVAAGNFGTLATAIKTAGLIETLKGEGPFTVFAPTDAAFAKLPEGTVAELLKPENRAKLTQILTYHVVAGRAFAREAFGAGEAATLQGGKLRFGVDAGRLTVNGANIVGTDIQTANGVIHVIDTVLLPR